MWLFLPVCPRDTNRQIMLAQTPCYYFFAFFSDFHCKSSWFNVGKQYDNILTRFVSSKNGLCVFSVPGTLWSSERFLCHIIFSGGDIFKLCVLQMFIYWNYITWSSRVELFWVFNSTSLISKEQRHPLLTLNKWKICSPRLYNAVMKDDFSLICWLFRPRERFCSLTPIN